MTTTPDVLEARALRDGARRPIPFEGLADVEDAKVRARAGAEWLSRMEQEHLAVGAFALLAHELAADGCEPIVLSLITRASADEVRHAEVCRRLAVELLGASAVPRGFRGVPNVPRHRGQAASTRTLLHVVEMCCLSETLTGVYFTEVLARVTHPTMHAAFESLLEDEIDHGRVGWAYLAERARSNRLEGLSEALPEMIERVVGKTFDRAHKAPEPDDPALVALGTVGNGTSAALFSQGLHDVILPGFEALDVDLGPARKRVAERGFVAHAAP